MLIGKIVVQSNFSDEKNFNLDGSDVMKFYWHDLKSQCYPFCCWPTNGAPVMVRNGTSAKGNT